MSDPSASMKTPGTMYRLWPNTVAYDTMIIERSWCKEPLFMNGWGQNIGLCSDLVAAHTDDAHTDEDKFSCDLLRYGKHEHEYDTHERRARRQTTNPDSFFTIAYYITQLSINYPTHDVDIDDLRYTIEYDNPDGLDMVYNIIRDFIKLQAISDMLYDIRTSTELDPAAIMFLTEKSIVSAKLTSVHEELRIAFGRINAIAAEIDEAKKARSKSYYTDEIPF